MGFTEQKDLAENHSFRRRLQMAVIKAALDIQAEDPATPNHAERSALAYRALHDPMGLARKMAYGAAVLPGESAKDAELQAAVAGIFNAYAIGGSA